MDKSSFCCSAWHCHFKKLAEGGAHLLWNTQFREPIRYPLVILFLLVIPGRFFFFSLSWRVILVTSLLQLIIVRRSFFLLLFYSIFFFNYSQPITSLKVEPNDNTHNRISEKGGLGVVFDPVFLYFFYNFYLTFCPNTPQVLAFRERRHFFFRSLNKMVTNGKG